MVVAQGVAVLVLTAVHAVLRFGLRDAFVLAFIAVGISLPAEWLGATKGWIFGSYDYTAMLYWKFAGTVPLFIPLAWYMLAYLSDAMAEMALPSSSTPVVRVLYRAVALTTWDFLFDPVCVVAGAWTWHGPVEYFGLVPLGNFLGWFVVSLAIFSCHEFWRGKDRSGGRSLDRVVGTWRHATPIAFSLLVIFLLAVFAVRFGESAAAAVGVAVVMPQCLLALAGYLNEADRTRPPAAIT